jgi:hypothetical protein
MELLVYVAVGVYIAICGGAGGYVAIQKRRDMLEGMLFGLLLGPFGVVTEACLPEGGVTGGPSEPGTLLRAMEDRRASEALANLEAIRKGGK